MEIQVNKNALKKQLDFVAVSLMAKAPDAILDNIKIEALQAGESKVTLTAAGQDTTSSASVEANVITPGTVLFPGKAFGKLAKNLTGIEVSMKKDGNSVAVKSDRYDGSFQSPDPDAFPAEIQKGDSSVLTIPRTELLAHLNTLAFAVNKDPAKRQLSAVNITKNGMCSTNGKVSAIINKEIPLPEGTTEINIPALVVPALIATLKKSEAENVDIYDQDAYLIFDMDDQSYAVRKIAITFPDIFTRVDNPTKEQNDKSVKLDNIELKAALGRVALTSDSNDAAVEFTFMFDGMAGDSVVLSSADGNNSSSKESLDAVFTGFENNGEGWNTKTKFDPDLLMGVLEAVTKDEVEITFCDNLRIPVRITNDDLTLLMMRVVN